MSEFKTALDTAIVICPRPLPFTDAHECEFTLNIGLFFDGTDNNKDDKKKEPTPATNTNVVRLWQAYKDSNTEGYFSHYVAGVGTPFTQIGETTAPASGGPLGTGGEERIIYGLLQVINSVHSFVNAKVNRFDDDQIAALCSDFKTPALNPDAAPTPPSARQKILNGLGLEAGLVGSGDRSFLGAQLHSPRRAFFMRVASELTQQLAALKRPRVKAIYIDVVGFSRGAAQARVFSSWLHDYMLSHGQLFGVKSYVRMMGLFDTVSSVGLGDPMGSDGHNGWAQEKDLRARPEVKMHVHYVALHELRSNFPSDSLGGPEGKLPDRCEEIFYPGVHSDVGGGYAAGVQGKGMRQVYQPADGTRVFMPDEGYKLSQLSLNAMYAAVKKSCVGHESMPWIELNSQQAKDLKLPERFAMTRNGEGVPHVENAVEAYFLKYCGLPLDAEGKPVPLTAREALRAHGLRYLAWRYRVNQRKDGFAELPSVERAGWADREGVGYYLEGEKILAKQLQLLAGRSGIFQTDDKELRMGFHANAPEIYASMVALAPRQDGGLEPFFDAWVHDSYAGFIGKFRDLGDKVYKSVHLLAEGQRYVRWRGLYCGGNVQLNALASQADDGRRLT